LKTGNINMFYGASKLIFRRAEELRKLPTHEEILMWGYLKENQLGVKFRRQHQYYFILLIFIVMN
jgi:very-short-patch-repair endonuclease